MLIRALRLSYQTSSKIENNRPGHNRKKFSGLNDHVILPASENFVDSGGIEQENE
jgi:hypothetical protein